MDSTVIIDFQTFITLVIGIFGLVGFVRGWWKEAITTGLLVTLLTLLKQPEWAQGIIDFFNRIILLITAFFTAGSLEPTEIAAAASTAQPPVTIDPGAFRPYIIILIILVVFSYFIGNAGIGNSVVTPIARLFGGILGLINGFVIISLLREYALRRFLPESGVSAATAVPDQITVQIAGVPQSTIMDGFTAWVFIIGGILILVLALGTRYHYINGKLIKRAPLGYKEG
jgi:uncharacterized membrane protein required for colicin V production